MDLNLPSLGELTMALAQRKNVGDVANQAMAGYQQGQESSIKKNVAIADILEKRAKMAKEEHDAQREFDSSMVDVSKHPNPVYRLMGGQKGLLHKDVITQLEKTQEAKFAAEQSTAQRAQEAQDRAETAAEKSATLKGTAMLSAGERIKSGIPKIPGQAVDVVPALRPVARIASKVFPFDWIKDFANPTQRELAGVQANKLIEAGSRQLLGGAAPTPAPVAAPQVPARNLTAEEYAALPSGASFFYNGKQLTKK